MTDERHIDIAEQQPDWHSMTADARTSWFISEMLSELTSEQRYEAAMNGVLNMMSAVIHTDRMSIFECSGSTTKVTFELCKEGVYSLVGASFELPRWVLNAWFKHIGNKPVALVSNIAAIESVSKPLYEWFIENDIHDFMAAPFHSEGEIVGFLGAYNAHVDESIDLEKLFSAVSAFIGARIENRQLIDRLAWAVDHDALTGLLNRRGGEKAIVAIHADNPKAPFTLALVDLDDFKRINDVYGHETGDIALQTLADALTAAFPPGTIVSRNGGDEFLLAFPGELASQADALIESFAGVDLAFDHDGESRQMSVSIGFAKFPEHCQNMNDLHARADAALYSVKLAGKAGFAMYSPEAGSHYRTRLSFSAGDIMENIPHSMVVTKADDSALLYASKRFMKLLDCNNMYDLTHLSNGLLTNVVPPEDRDAVREGFTSHARDDDAEGGWAIDFSVITKTGAIKPVHAITLFVDIEGIGKVAYSSVNER